MYVKLKVKSQKNDHGYDYILFGTLRFNQRFSARNKSKLKKSIAKTRFCLCKTLYDLFFIAYGFFLMAFISASC